MPVLNADHGFSAADKRLRIVFSQYCRRQTRNPLRKLLAGSDRIPGNTHIDASRYDLVAYLPSPILGDPFHSAQNTQNGADRRACAIRVIPAIDGGKHGFFKVAFSVQQTQNYESYIGRSLKPSVADIRIQGNDFVARFMQRRTVFETLFGKTHRFRHAAILGNAEQGE